MTTLTHGLRIVAAGGALALMYCSGANAAVITRTIDACDHAVGTDASSVARGATLAMMSRDQVADTFVYAPALIQASHRGDLPLTGCGRTIGSQTDVGMGFFTFIQGDPTPRWFDHAPFGALRVDFTPRVREVSITGWDGSSDGLMAILVGPNDQYLGTFLHETVRSPNFDDDDSVDLWDWRLNFSLAGQMPLAYMVLAGWADSGSYVTSISYSVRVPEPATLSLLGLGLLGMGIARRRKAA